MDAGLRIEQPTLDTERFLLRPLEMSDVFAMHTLSNDPDVSANLADMPYPYPREAAVGTVEAMQNLAARGEAFAFALILREGESKELVGVIYLIVNPVNQHGELIYWIGKSYWGLGYATEALRAVIIFAFNRLKLHRVYAHVFQHNMASSRVLQKVGMQYEGMLRDHVFKNGQFIDLLCYGLLREEFKFPA